MNRGEIESELWQLYKTDDEEKLGRLFKAVANVCDDEDMDRCLAYAWGDCDVYD